MKFIYYGIAFNIFSKLSHMIYHLASDLANIIQFYYNTALSLRRLVTNENLVIKIKVFQAKTMLISS